MEFAVRREEHPSASVLLVHGELDVSTAKILRGEVATSLAARPVRLCLNLSPTTFIDSSGCRELMRAAKDGDALGVPVELVIPTGNWRVRRVVDFMQFGELLTVHDEAPYA